MNITPEAVKELREKTLCGMMDCKKALQECGGDMDKAVEYLRKKGLASAEKKGERNAAQGTVAVHADKNGRILVEVNCETDFVAKNPDFKKFVGDVLQHIAQKAPKDVQDLLSQQFIGDPKVKVEEAVKGIIAKFGENTLISRFIKYPADSKSSVESYIHLDSKIGVLVEVGFEKDDTAEKPEVKCLVKDLALQIAAQKPQYVKRDEVPQAVIDHEKEILRSQAANEKKPAGIIEKMVEGRLGKFFGDFCLIDQAFIREPEKKISDIIKDVSSKAGDTITVKRFTRYQVGEKT